VPLRRADAALGLELELELKLVLHVTVLVPFAPVVSAPMRERLAAIAAAAAPFDVTLRRLERFEVEEPNVLWLTPEPAEPFVALTRSVEAAFPAYPSFAGRYAEVVPRATLGAGERAELDLLAARLAPRLPLADRAETLELVGVSETLELEARWPLGG
jgi:2'-5' RNA ligase